MALPVRDQMKYWGIATVVFAVVLWFLGDVLLPFVLGGAIAYCLDPLADWLEERGLTRQTSVAVITVAAALVFVFLALAVIPLLIQQSIQLIDTAPELFRQLQTFLSERFPSFMVEDSPLRQALGVVGDFIRERGGELFQTALSSAMSFLNLVILFVIVPVVAVYMLVDWDNMVAAFDNLIPRDHLPTVRYLTKEIDRVLNGFIRGMGSVCIVLGMFYAVSLWAVGLQFGLVVGVIAGFLTFIPYIGAIFGGTLAIGLSLFQFWGEWHLIAAVAAIFGIGQFMEGNVLTPRWVGSSVGLHPVWLLLALSVFGSLFGFVGMLVAVPLAAALGVLTRFAANQYRSSLLYRGLESVSDQESQSDV